MTKHDTGLYLSFSMRIVPVLVSITLGACGTPVTPADALGDRDRLLDGLASFDGADSSTPFDEFTDVALDGDRSDASFDVGLTDTPDTLLLPEVCARQGPDDPDHCGPLCVQCASLAANTVATCAQNRCGFRCSEGFDNCNANDGDGCEASLSAVTSCGACGTRCSVPDHAMATCVGGACGYDCLPGWQRSGENCVRMPIRPVLPFSGFEVSTRRPRFRWILPESYDDATIVICSDPECRMELIRVTSPAGTSEFVPMNPLPNGPIWWKVEGRVARVLSGESAIWEAWIPRAMKLEVGGSVRPIFDLDRDGWVDLVGCSSEIAGRNECWIVRNNLRTRGPILRSALQLPPLLPADLATVVAENGGDTDGDGHPSVVLRSLSGAGSVYYLTGGMNGRTDRTDLYRFSERETDVLGDIDLDGYADLRVRRRPLPPAMFELVWVPGNAERANLNATVAFSDNALPYGIFRWLGDRDGDGQAEYVLTTTDTVQLLRFSTNRASQSSLLWRVSGLNDLGPFVGPIFDKFGAADTNGDGQTDLLACGWPMFGRCQMRNYTRVSADPRQGFTIRVDDSRDPVGSQLDGRLYSFYAGDLNGDGYDDVAVSHVRPEMGLMYNHLYIVAGRPGAQPLVYQRVMGFPETTESGYGSDTPAVGVGDYDRDGYDDLIIPAPFRTSLRIIRGGPDLSQLRAEPLDSAAPRNTYYQISQ